MKKRIGLMLIVLLAAVLALSACGGTAEPAVEEAAAPAAEAALTVGEKGYSMADLEGMETMVVESEKKDGTTVEYTGVKVTDLLADAGTAGETVVFVASDGYEAELAFAELEGCADCLVAFDDGELRMVLPGFPGNVQVKGVVEIKSK
jgi:hypothetical protein